VKIDWSKNYMTSFWYSPPRRIPRKWQRIVVFNHWLFWRSTVTESAAVNEHVPYLY